MLSLRKTLPRFFRAKWMKKLTRCTEPVRFNISVFGMSWNARTRSVSEPEHDGARWGRANFHQKIMRDRVWPKYIKETAHRVAARRALDSKVQLGKIGWLSNQAEHPRKLKSNTLFWRLATLPLRVPSPQRSLIAVFGMRTDVTSAIKHQNKVLDHKIVKVNSWNLSADEAWFIPCNRITPTFQSEPRPFRASGSLLIFKFSNRNRLISTPRLNTLLCLHLVPITW